MKFLGHNELKIIIKINSVVQNFPETKKGLRFRLLYFIKFKTRNLSEIRQRPYYWHKGPLQYNSIPGLSFGQEMKYRGTRIFLSTNFLALNIWPLWKAFDYGQPWLYTEYYSEYGILSLF